MCFRVPFYSGSGSGGATDRACTDGEWYFNYNPGGSVRALQEIKNSIGSKGFCEHVHAIPEDGGGQSHTHSATSPSVNYMPPYLALLYIMKT
jgi:hypothetical protein